MGKQHKVCNSNLQKTLRIALEQEILLEVKGVKRIYFIDDTLYIRVHAVNDIVYEYKRPHISGDVNDGWTARLITQDFVKKYKRYVLNLFLTKIY